MRTVEVNVYKLHELSEEAKTIALNRECDAILDLDWWESVYYDAALVGITIKGFDLDASCIELELESNPFDVCTKIVAEHGEDCNTYKVAKQWLKDLNKLIAQGVTDARDNDLEDLEASLVDLLGECYLHILTEELKYLHSIEYLTESIEANEFEFLSDGSIYKPLN